MKIKKTEMVKELTRKLTFEVELPDGKKKIVPIHELGISATSSELFSEEVKKLWNIDLIPIGPGFNGPAFVNGEPVPCVNCDGPESMSEVSSIDDYLSTDGYATETREGLGLSPFTMVENAYFELDPFKKKILSLDKKSSEWEDDCSAAWADYQQGFLSRLAEIAMANLSFEKGKKAGFFRFKTNARCRQIQADLAAYLHLDREYEFVEFYGGKRGGKPTVKELCRPVFRENKYALIFATADARLSCPFGNWCTFFVDFTQSSSTCNALLQGSFGRSCGYNKVVDGKPPLVLVSPDVKLEFDNLVENDFQLGAHSKNACTRTTKSGAKKSPRKGGIFNLSLLIRDNEFLGAEQKAHILDGFNQGWVQYKRPLQSKPNDDDNLMLNTILKHIILPTEFLRNVSKYFPPEYRHIQVLTWGEKDQSPEYGFRAPSSDCDICIEGRACPDKGHPAFTMNIKSTDERLITVGYSTSLLPPESIRLDDAYQQFFREKDGVARRPGAGNLSRYGLRNSSGWDASKREKGGALPPSLILRFREDTCPSCKKNIAHNLWRMVLDDLIEKEKKKYTAHWPKEILDSCCFANSNVDLLEIILRTKQSIDTQPESLDSTKDDSTKIPLHIKSNSRHFPQESIETEKREGVK